MARAERGRGGRGGYTHPIRHTHTHTHARTHAHARTHVHPQITLNQRDTEFASWTSNLGFPVMGIWPPYSDGTDVNSVDRSKDQKVGDVAWLGIRQLQALAARAQGGGRLAPWGQRLMKVHACPLIHEPAARLPPPQAPPPYKYWPHSASPPLSLVQPTHTHARTHALAQARTLARTYKHRHTRMYTCTHASTQS